MTNTTVPQGYRMAPRQTIMSKTKRVLPKRNVHINVQHLPDAAEKQSKRRNVFLFLLLSCSLLILLISAILIPLLILYLNQNTTTTTTSVTNSTTTVTSTTSTSTSMTSTSTSSTISSSTTMTTTTTSSAIIYSQSFTNNLTPTAECTAWDVFRSQLISRPYTNLIISGSLDPIGITLTNATLVQALANALLTNTAYGPVSSNGYAWAVGLCAVSGSQYELTATGSICACNTGYTVRPCIGNTNWGGINSATCSGLTQTMTVAFQ